MGKTMILVVEDEPAIADAIQYALESEGFHCHRLEAGAEVVAVLERQPVALVVLDIGLPDVSGIEVCRRIRQRHDVPVIFLTARGAEVDRVVGLELGADDYVTKPFSPRELVARVRAVLRRAEAVESGEPSNVFERGRLRIDFDRHEAWLDGKPLELSLREFQLLRFFVRNPNRVYDRLTILDLVWGNDTYVEPRTVDVHVRRLRLLVERDPSNPELIQTVRGVGYRFNEAALGA